MTEVRERRTTAWDGAGSDEVSLEETMRETTTESPSPAMRASAFLMLLALLLLLAVPATAQTAVTGRFRLDDHDGHRVTQDSYAGKLRLMTFGYTYCPDICPTSLGTMAGALTLLGDAAAQVVPIFVTVDPQRDTAAHLKDYLDAFGPRFVGLTGTARMVDDAAKAFRVRYVIHPPAAGEPDSYVVDHSAGIYIMDRDGAFLAKLPHLMGADEVAERLRPLLK
ncbi:MAG: SCO family protein [Magnetospirillum sp.]|nr:SCO family protein [Magnetospirillum sp.]